MKRLVVLVGLAVLLGGTWALSDTGPPTGTVRVATPGMVVKVKIQLDRTAKKPNEVPLPAGKDAFLPLGTFDVAAVQLFKQDARRDVWCLNAISEFGKLKMIQVAEGQTVSLEGGEPLKIRTRLVTTTGKPKPARAGTAPPAGPPPAPIKTVTVFIDYVGQAGEAYGPKILKGTAPPIDKPIVRITDESGKVLSEGQYNYGSKGYGGFG